MAKRFGDTEIWKRQRWFRKLPPEYKLAFCYIKDQCDHAGIWKIDCSDLVEDLGIGSFELKNFVSSVNTEYDKITGSNTIKERLIIINNSILWITGFIQFQYEGKNKIVVFGNNVVNSALYLLDSLLFSPSEPLIAPHSPLEPLTALEYAIRGNHLRVSQPLPVLRQGLAALKDKDKDKDKDNTVKHKRHGKSENGFSGNFKAQGEELFAERHRKRLEEDDRSRSKDSESKE